MSVLFTTAYRLLLPSLVTPEDPIDGNAKLQDSAAAAAIGGRAPRNLPPQPAAAMSRAR